MENVVQPSTGYPGAKYAYGSYMQIINEFPPHDNFITGFAGSCAVGKHKLPARRTNIAFELDEKVLEKYWKETGFELHCEDFIKWFRLTHKSVRDNTLIYLDPPYLLHTRKQQRMLYRNELTERQHRELLELITDTKALVAISAYKCELYNTMLKGWRVKEWQVMTRAGVKQECLYMNYPEPKELHQYNYLGENKTIRQALRRKKHNFVMKLERLPYQERYMLISAVKEYTEGKYKPTTTAGNELPGPLDTEITTTPVNA